ncbi:MAG: thermonuclease family protein [Gammaproteobacteria bacterium]|nr:thermonuclease family protein [Gammaproteobacteria bacterium]
MLVNRRLLAILTGAAFGLVASTGACSRESPERELFLSATLVRVVDGDTIDVNLDSGPLTIRLHGIDTPERKQPLGPPATKALRSLVEGQPLEIEPIERNDGYGRMVAKVFVAGDDVNARMVETGYAWAYRRYLRREPVDESYCRLEAGARAAGRGVWVGAPEKWEPPWIFRARQRGDNVPDSSYADETAERCIAAFGKKGPRSAGSGPVANCRIKGNINSKGVRIYHEPGRASYASTDIDMKKGERWFCSVAEAERAGWRAPK